MAETTDSNDTDAISGFGGADDSTVDGASGTLQGRSVLGGEAFWNLVYITLYTDV